VHAVSVGETRAAAPVVRALQSRLPGHRILVTSTTPTGRATAIELFGDSVLVAYLPYDLPIATRRFLGHFRPRYGLLMETEIWPNLLRAASGAGVPVFLVNARMSERSARGYRRVGALSRAALGLLSGIAAQTRDDAERLERLGASSVIVAGNVKFDATPPAGTGNLAREFRRLFGSSRPVWLAASTREGEEALLLDVLHAVHPENALLVMVPRHPQRFDEVAAMLAERGIPFQRRSEGSEVHPETRVLLGDSMGEMYAYYEASDAAFIGGSLLALGGQNPIEAFAVGTPAVVGPHTFNFADVTKAACAAGAAAQVASVHDVARTISDLLQDAQRRRTMACAGLEFARVHRGATERTLAMIERSIGRCP
ncbi:MAG: 3-deoxy-D-manno-octulosonic acid transferase, partial [Burkholderiaceae bacterium]|nr:3-deoxy-D-manno-octulosonic acid transferase [Burkholderiaceae bacterium]